MSRRSGVEVHKLAPELFPSRRVRRAMAAEGTCGCCESSTRATDEEGIEGRTCYCPFDTMLDTVAKEYSMQVVSLLGADGPTRFGELETRLGTRSSSTLSDRLAELLEADLIERRSFDEVPPRVEYSLTPRGRELETRLQPLLEWASQDR
jgi:DNA-binding HxlR family transcriptional regulator